jgi:hypothetical protein
MYIHDAVITSISDHIIVTSLCHARVRYLGEVQPMVVAWWPSPTRGDHPPREPRRDRGDVLQKSQNENPLRSLFQIIHLNYSKCMIRPPALPTNFIQPHRPPAPAALA